MAKKKGPATGPKSKHRFSHKPRDAPAEKPSAFEARSGRLKFDILGRKVRGEKGNALRARAAGVAKRKNTLLREYDAAGSANAFVDRRFGEGDQSMTPEERAIGRLARARLRQLRPNKRSFALNDDDDDDGGGGGGGGARGGYASSGGALALTHGGVPIDEAALERRSSHAAARGRGGRASGGGGDGSDSDDLGGLDRDATAAMHFGGGGDDGEGEDDGAFTLKRGDHGVDEGVSPDGRRKTKKEVMDELIRKSKTHKAERARRREADEDLLDKLDEDFKHISADGGFRAALSKGVGHLKPEGWTKGGTRAARGSEGKERRANGSGGDRDDAAIDPRSTTVQGGPFALNSALTLAATATTADGSAVRDDYDRLARELALEARGQAADRTRTAEELEAAEAAALEAAERGRLKRMRAEDGDGSDSDSDGSDGRAGGYAARRARAKRGDEKLAEKKRRKAAKGEDDSDDSDDSDSDSGSGSDRGGRAGEAARRGGDDLEGNFALSDEEDASDASGSGSESASESDGEGEEGGEETRAMKRELGTIKDLERGKRRLRKLGILKDGGDEASEEEEEEVEEEEGGGEEDEDEEDEEEDEEDEDEDEDEEASEEEASDPASEPASEPQHPPPSPQPMPPPAASSLPFVFDMPETPEALDRMLAGLRPSDASLALERARKLHAPSLRDENRKKTQTFFNLLLMRFESLAGARPLPTADLDVLATHLAATAPTVPFYAATACRARLEKMSRRLRAALRAGETGWPPARTVLLLCLFADLFPTTDKAHPVTTPAALYLGNVLAHCAVRSAREAAKATVVLAAAAAYAAPAGRTFPEALVFAAALAHAAGAEREDKADWGAGLPAHVREQIGGAWLAPEEGREEDEEGKKTSKTRAKKSAGKKASSSPDAPPRSVSSSAAPLSIAALLVDASSEDSAVSPSAEAFDRRSALAALGATLRSLMAPFAATACAKEFLRPVLEAADRVLAALRRANHGAAKKNTGDASIVGGDSWDVAVEVWEGVRSEASRRVEDSSARLAPLRWRRKAAEAIKQFNPAYEEEGYQKGRDYDPNRERAEARRLQRQLRKEARGAARELRKDNRFLAERRSEEAAAGAEERGERQAETLAFLEKMEGDLKSGGQGGVIVKTQRRVNGARGRDRKQRGAGGRGGRG